VGWELGREGRVVAEGELQEVLVGQEFVFPGFAWERGEKEKGRRG
jgi:hypothetical protein